MNTALDRVKARKDVSVQRQEPVSKPDLKPCVLRVWGVYKGREDHPPKSVLLETVDCMNVRLGRMGVHLLCGVGSSATEIAEMEKGQIGSGEHVYEIEVMVKALRLASGEVGMDTLPYIDNLHVMRCKADLRQHIDSLFLGWLKKPRDVDPWENQGGVVANHPWLIDRLHRHKDFKHLKSINYPVVSRRAQGQILHAQRIAIYDPEIVVSARLYSFPEARIRCGDRQIPAEA
jgi:hypothetical protein